VPGEREPNRYKRVFDVLAWVDMGATLIWHVVRNHADVLQQVDWVAQRRRDARVMCAPEAKRTATHLASRAA